MARTSIALALTLGLLAPGLVAPAVGSAQQQPLSVRIVAPHAGVVVGPIVSFEAEVSDPTIEHATLVVNGSAYDVPIVLGRVSQQVVAITGQNRVALAVHHGGATVRDSLTFRYDGPPMELVVLLTWPTEGEIIDLWVREPDGETCKWDHRSTEAGGELLDFSANAIGFGSQGYTRGRVAAGRYRLKVHYWGARAQDDARSWYSYRSLLSRLDQNEARRGSVGQEEAERLEVEARGIRARLDEFARPAPTQTRVRAEVILFPGSPNERRWRFDRTVHRSGELITLGEIEIDEAMLRGAREVTR